MSKVIVLILLLLATAITTVQAQSAVPIVAPADTLEKLENAEAYKQYLADSILMTSQSQAQIDSLFKDHDAIVKTLQAEAAKDLSAEKVSNEKTLKALRAEEAALRKELNKEKKKTENWFNRQVNKSMRKTKYETADEE
ncbi:MAG: hypothetical protein EOP54_09615 [Sphingobacteriales bacterium]|nr:MAG: hypothetical protein EOP54_09615 [Sphingobacteriales bacterium]